MKKSFKILALILSIGIIFSLVGCGDPIASIKNTISGDQSSKLVGGWSSDASGNDPDTWSIDYEKESGHYYYFLERYVPQVTSPSGWKSDHEYFVCIVKKISNASYTLELHTSNVVQNNFSLSEDFTTNTITFNNDNSIIVNGSLTGNSNATYTRIDQAAANSILTAATNTENDAASEAASEAAETANYLN